MKILPLVLILAALPAAAGFAQALVVPTSPESTQDFLKRMQPVLERDAAVAKIKTELAKIIVSLHLRDTPLSTALDTLNDSIRTHNAGPGAVQVPLVRIEPLYRRSPHPPFFSASFPAWLMSVRPEFLGGKPPDVDYKYRVTLSLANIKMDEAIDYVTKLSGLMMDIKPDGIWLLPLSPGESMEVKPVYYIPPSVCSTKEEMAKWFDTDLPASGAMGLISWSFDVKGHILALRCTDSYLGEFEKWYAMELLRHGFKADGK